MAFESLGPLSPEERELVELYKKSDIPSHAIESIIALRRKGLDKVEPNEELIKRTMEFCRPTLVSQLRERIRSSRWLSFKRRLRILTRRFLRKLFRK